MSHAIQNEGQSGSVLYETDAGCILPPDSMPPVFIEEITEANPPRRVLRKEHADTQFVSKGFLGEWDMWCPAERGGCGAVEWADQLFGSFRNTTTKRKKPPLSTKCMTDEK